MFIRLQLKDLSKLDNIDIVVFYVNRCSILFFFCHIHSSAFIQYHNIHTIKISKKYDYYISECNCLLYIQYKSYWFIY